MGELRRELESPLESYLNHFEEGALDDILAGPGIKYYDPWPNEPLAVHYVHAFWSPLSGRRPMIHFALPPSLIETNTTPVESDDELVD